MISDIRWFKEEKTNIVVIKGKRRFDTQFAKNKPMWSESTISVLFKDVAHKYGIYYVGIMAVWSRESPSSETKTSTWATNQMVNSENSRCGHAGKNNGELPHGPESKTNNGIRFSALLKPQLSFATAKAEMGTVPHHVLCPTFSSQRNWCTAFYWCSHWW